MISFTLIYVFLLSVSQVLGFGLMNAEAMVTRAKVWTTVPIQQTCTGSTNTVYLYVITCNITENNKTKNIHVYVTSCDYI